MENYFCYYKGYKDTTKKELNKYIFLAFAIFMLITFLSGFIVSLIVIAKGKDISYIMDESPIVIPMSLISLILFFISLIIFIRRYKNDKNPFKNIDIYLDDEAINIKYKILNNNLIFKTWKLDVVKKDNIKDMVVTDLIKIIFLKDEKEYFILLNKNQEILNWFGSDNLES